MLLGINTVGAPYGVMGGEGFPHFFSSFSSERGEDLIPLLQRICPEGPSSLEGIFITTGPGRFTLLRMGVTAGKGLGHFLGIPLMEVTTLEWGAYQIKKEGTILAYLPFKEVLWAEFFTREKDRWETVCRCASYTKEELLHKVETYRPDWAIGPSPLDGLYTPFLQIPDLDYNTFFALGKKKWQAHQFVEPNRLLPIY